MDETQIEDNNARYMALHYHDTGVTVSEPFTIESIKKLFEDQGWPQVSDRYLDAFRRECVKARMMQPNTHYGISAGPIFKALLVEGAV